MENIYEWIGFVIFWLITFAAGLGVTALVLMYLLVKFDIDQFKFRVVLTERYCDLFAIYSRLIEARRWFASFTEVCIVFDHIIHGKGRIEDVRKQFADSLRVTVYNKPLEEQPYDR